MVGEVGVQYMTDDCLASREHGKEVVLDPAMRPLRDGQEKTVGVARGEPGRQEGLGTL